MRGMKMMQKVQIILAVLLIFSLVAIHMVPSEVAAKKTSATMVSVVQKSAGKNYPFTVSDRKTSHRMLFGVMTSRLKDYAAYEKISGSGSNTAEYLLFVGKASSSATAKRNASSLKRYVDREYSSMGNYLSTDGKKLFQGAKTGSKGKWCWLVMISPSAKVNKKALKAMKKKM